ncbi:caspase family protein [Actinoplanes sp. N902-109]|uniref:caspase family protein n=1 Tax=Actinoplanes sp. (strain N902-109) TaxID=649831 RepID=UPI0018DBF52A|nr:caspase family protein [Actinoplanes sp. N902-109]
MGERHALLIANDDYQHADLQKLTAPGHDVEALHQVLGDPGIGGFTVKVLRNVAHHVITRAVAEFFADRHPDDLLLVHFSGHGLKSAGGDLFLAGTDTCPAPAMLPATAVDARFLNREMHATRARQVVLLLDCCYGGAFVRGLVPRRPAAEPVSLTDSFTRPPGTADRTQVIITASSATQFAFEDERLADTGERRPSVFTSALTHGLATGDADLGGDGIVDLDELYDYLYDRLEASGSPQTPTKVVVSATGKTELARTPPARRITARPPLLPPGRPDSGNDLATVAMLRRLLLDEDVEAAAGALDALRDLSTDDSRTVAVVNAARAALDEAQLRTVPAAIDIEAGTDEPVTHSVRLVGAPLAKLCHATTTSRWLRITHTRTDELSVTIHPAALPESSQHAHTGEITVTNRIGETHLPVRVSRPTTRTGWSLDSAWLTRLRKPPVLVAATVLAYTLCLINSVGFVRAFSAFGVLFFALHIGLTTAGLRMISSPRHRPAGAGLLASGAAYLMTDAFSMLRGSTGAGSWFEFLAATAFTTIAGLHFWPFTQLPRKLHRRSLRGRPIRLLAIGAAGGYLLLFVSSGTGYSADTLLDFLGLPGSLTSVVAVTALTVTVMHTEPTPPQRTFTVTAVAGYFAPEMVMLAGSFVIGPRYVYLGSTVWSADTDATWFVGVQLCVIAVLLAAVVLALRRTPRRVRTPA